MTQRSDATTDPIPWSGRARLNRERAAEVAERMVSMGDVFATIYKAFGIDWKKEYMSPIGRPIKIANAIGDITGVPIEELV